jgi:hypothetical protein
MGALRLNLGVLVGVVGVGDVGAAVVEVVAGGVVGVDGVRILLFLDCGVDGWPCFAGATLGLLTIVLLIVLVVVLLLLLLPVFVLLILPVFVLLMLLLLPLGMDAFTPAEAMQYNR